MVDNREAQYNIICIAMHNALFRDLQSSLLKVSFSLALFVTAVLIVPKITFAKTDCSTVGSWFSREAIQCKLKNMLPSLDIRRTMMNMVSDLVGYVPLQLVWNLNFDEIMGCGFWRASIVQGPGWAGQFGVSAADMQAKIDALGIPDADKEKICSTPMGIPVAGGYNKYAYYRQNGSLVGMVATAGNIVQNEPLPVNLAYYFNRMAMKLPVLKDTAFAQSTSYRAAGLPLIYDLWETARNIAYGIMAIVLIILGVMIMTRQKINPQVVLTAEQALPKVIISLVLITFSYPLGATIISFVPSLITLVFTAFFSQALTELVVNWSSGMGYLQMLFMIIVLVFSGSAAMLIFAALLLIVVFLVVLLISLIKIIFIYIKMLVSIVASPFIFAIGALPGQDNQIPDWFKGMISKLLSVAAIFFMQAMAFYVLFKALTADYLSLAAAPDATNPLSAIFNAIGGPTFVNVAGGAANLWLTVLFLPFIIIFILVASLSMPSKIEAMIMGDPKKRR